MVARLLQSVAPKRVLVTGAAGQIGYSIVPMICSGEFLGPNQPVIIHLLDIAFMADKLTGVKMEIDDCAFPLVKGSSCFSCLRFRRAPNITRDPLSQALRAPTYFCMCLIWVK
jgi:hypothetical protein